jgi:hypothetical protein
MARCVCLSLARSLYSPRCCVTLCLVSNATLKSGNVRDCTVYEGSGLWFCLRNLMAGIVGIVSLSLALLYSLHLPLCMCDVCDYYYCLYFTAPNATLTRSPANVRACTLSRSGF